MTAPQTIDTDALWKLCEAAPKTNDWYAVKHANGEWTIQDREGGVGIPIARSYADSPVSFAELIVAARNALPSILDELDRLRAAEAASKARVDEEERAQLQIIDQRDAAEDALSRAYLLVTGNQANWSNGFGYEDALEEIESIVAARAEIARLTDAGAEHVNASVGAGQQPVGEQSPEPVAADQNAEANAPGAIPLPPAVADRGVPGQRVSDARLATLIHELSKQPSEPRYSPALRDLHDCRAALATAPKAEDVRREAIEECAKVCDEEHRDRYDRMQKAATGDPSWGDPRIAELAQGHKSITAVSLAAKIRALADRPAS